MADCLFCRLAAGEVPAQLLYQDERALAFPDINPQAPLHALVIPRRHIGGVAELAAADAELAGHLLWVAREVARAQGVAEDGYRVVINSGRHGQQTVPHLHVHVLGGRQLNWPPG